jgi:hypothetical protein
LRIALVEIELRGGEPRKIAREMHLLAPGLEQERSLPTQTTKEQPQFKEHIVTHHGFPLPTED